MQTKTFSVKDGNLVIEGGEILLIGEKSKVLASTTSKRYQSIHLLPSTLIRTTKTDEELAEEYVYDMFITTHNKFIGNQSFLAGRKSVGGEFHLTRDELLIVYNAMVDNIIFKDIIASLTPPIYPTTITVEHDGEKYLWETLKAEY